MPSPYAGNGTVPTTTSSSRFRFQIQSTTNTTPISVTTTGAHGFNTGDTVEIEGGDTVNGVYQIDVTGANSFTLRGSTAPGAIGLANGYCIDYQVQPAITIPSSGDLAQAGDVALIGEAAANFQPFMNRRAGAYRLHYRASEFGYPSPGDPFSSTVLTSANSASPNFLGGAAPIFPFLTGGDNPIYMSGDVLEADYTTTGHITTGMAAVRIFIAFYLNIGAVNTVLLQSALIMRETDVAIPLHFRVVFGIGGLIPPVGTNYNIGLCAWMVSLGSTPTLELWSPWAGDIKQWRPN
jgi:hypothetical protein